MPEEFKSIKYWIFAMTVALLYGGIVYIIAIHCQ